MAKPGRPKNDGTMLVVRISAQTHVYIARLQAHMIENGLRPGLATKTRVVEEAIAFAAAQPVANMPAGWPGDSDGN